MSSFRDLKSQLAGARNLFDSSEYAKSLDVFADLLQRPRIRTEAARAFLNLFTCQPENLALAPTDTIIQVVRLSFEALTRAKDKRKTQDLSRAVKQILRDSYQIQVPQSMPLTIGLKGVRGIGGRSIADLPGDASYLDFDVDDSDEGGGGGGRGGGRGVGGGGASGDPDEPLPREPRVVRTPHMDLGKSAPFQPNDRFAVQVYVDKQASRPGEESEDVILEGGKPEYKLKVFLSTSSGLQVDGAESQTLTIQTSKDRADCEPFWVRVVSAAPLEEATITASFFYEGRSCGGVTRSFPVAEDTDQVTRIQPNAKHADLSVSIIAKKKGADRDFDCIVSTPHIASYREGVKDPSGWSLNRSAADIVNGYLAGIQDKGTDATSRAGALRSAGLDLFESSPALFQEVFWRLVDEKQSLETILIVSEETTYPWELMIANDETHGQHDYPLGVECAIGRWVTSRQESPNQLITLEDAYLIAPDYNADRAFKFAPDEIESLEDCFQASGGSVRPIKPAGVKEIDDALGAQAATLLHFICHGKTGSKGDPDNADPTDQVIILDNEKPLSARIVRGLKGFTRAFGKAHPLVFLNACEVGQQVPALHGTGGFAQAFIRIGASGIIAALWPVEDEIASAVAKQFYTRLRDQKRIRCAEFLQEVRKRAYLDGDEIDTYAAYCFYGDPWGEVAIGGVVRTKTAH